MLALMRLFMEKWLCLGSMGVAGFLALLFLLDLVGFGPFGQAVILDIIGLLACGLVGFLAWDAYKDVK
jgi:hypothetical protein